MTVGAAKGSDVDSDRGTPKTLTRNGAAPRSEAAPTIVGDAAWSRPGSEPALNLFLSPPQQPPLVGSGPMRTAGWAQGPRCAAARGALHAARVAAAAGRPWVARAEPGPGG